MNIVLPEHTIIFFFCWLQLARQLKLKNLPECDGLSGGASVEKIAKRGDHVAFRIPDIMSAYPDCNFSFSGLHSSYIQYVEREEKKQGKSDSSCTLWKSSQSVCRQQSPSQISWHTITKTCLYNFDPFQPHFYTVKLGFTGVYIIFLISAQRHRLLVFVRTASSRRF